MAFEPSPIPRVVGRILKGDGPANPPVRHHRRGQQRLRDGEAEGFGGLEVDDQLELGR